MHIKGIKYVSFYENSGYGISAYRYLKGLINAGVPLTWTPMVTGRAWRLGYQPFLKGNLGQPWLSPYCNKQIDYDTLIIHTVPEYFPLWKQKEPDKKIIGYTVSETNDLPKHWLPLLNCVDQLLVPCQWNREVFQRGGVTRPIEVVPHIINDEQLPSVIDYPDISRQDYVFYSVNAWTIRKALLDTVEAFCEAFTGQDNVVLLIKTSREDFTRRPFWHRIPHRSQETVRKFLQRYSNPPRIVLITKELSNDQMLQLHARADCYISLTHSEGWGMGAFDAAGFGKPVIMTNYGGQLDFLSPQFSYLVDYQLVPAEEQINHYYDNIQYWAGADLHHARTLLREIYQDRENAAHRATAQQPLLHSQFNHKVITERLLDALEK